jgi:glycine oxidase
MRVVVVGGGVIGLASAWQLAARGDAVTVVDPSPGHGASWVAAGMLAPVAEAYQGEEVVTRLGVAASTSWRRWAAELAAAADRDPGYSRNGTLVIARDPDELARLHPLLEVQRAEGLASERVSSRDARRIEPALAPTVRGGLWMPDDHQVDNRAYVEALLAATSRVGVELLAAEAARITTSSVDTTAGATIPADRVVVATGAWPPSIETTAGALALPVRPVKGQILRLRATDHGVFPTRTIRGLDVYVVPRRHGEIVVGATVEERGYDTTVTAGAVRDLLVDAHELLPGLAEAELVETAAGLRPGTPDNAPIIGTTADGLTIATGHYRHGVLLSPITAEAVSRLVHDEAVPDAVHACGIERFEGVLR